MEGEEECERCDATDVRRAVASVDRRERRPHGKEPGESPSRLSLSSSMVRRAVASAPRKRAGRKSFLALALADGASSERCGELWPAWTANQSPRAETSREKVLLGCPSRCDLVDVRRCGQRVRCGAGDGSSRRVRSERGWRSARVRRKKERRKSHSGGQFWRGEGAGKGRPWRCCCFCSVVVAGAGGWVCPGRALWSMEHLRGNQ